MTGNDIQAKERGRKHFKGFGAVWIIYTGLPPAKILSNIQASRRRSNTDLFTKIMPCKHFYK